MLRPGVLLLCFACATATAFGASVWTAQESGTLAWLYAIRFTSDQNGLIAGSSGTLLFTNDGGRNWRAAAKPTNDNIRDIHFTGDRIGWLLCDRRAGASGQPSYLLKTVDGGGTWDALEFEDAPERFSRFVAGDGELFAVGEAGAAFRLEKDGAAWRRVFLPVRVLLTDGAFVRSGRIVMVGGAGTILQTSNGGVDWDLAGIAGRKPERRFSSVVFVDATFGWASGADGRLLHSADGGRTWRQQATGIETELSAVHFLNAKEGFAGGEGGVILHTRDGGMTWERMRSPTRHRIERILFVNGRGFAVGFGGTILNYRPVSF
jgi:photosystem II stability/assembly factor-like uncharacterized protein